MIDQINKNTESRMAKCLDTLKSELVKLRAGRANPALLEKIQVNYYDNDVPLTQVASITVENARTLKVTPWEKNMVTTIEKAIRASELGLNPVTAGNDIRVPLPALTEDRRKEMIRIVRDEGEKARIAVRNVRRDANAELNKLLKDKKIGEDEERRAQTAIQKTTDKFVDEIEKILSAKEADLISV